MELGKQKLGASVPAPRVKPKEFRNVLESH